VPVGVPRRWVRAGRRRPRGWLAGRRQRLLAATGSVAVAGGLLAVVLTAGGSGHRPDQVLTPTYRVVPVDCHATSTEAQGFVLRCTQTNLADNVGPSPNAG
jgi:hypothetical protein